MSRYREIYRAEGLPVMQNRMFDSAAEARSSARGDVVLVQDLERGLICNRAFRPELLVYDHSYQNEQAVSGVFQRHLEQVAKIVEAHMAGERVVEIGCGKGHFLEQLQRMGFDVVGLDPTYEGENRAVIREFFGPETGVRGGGIVLRHVLEHIPDPVAFLRNIRDVNGGGKIYIEVPSLEWIADNRSWFDVFYEHVNYFRLEDFHRIFGVVHEAGHTFGGQYLYAVADLASVREPRMNGAGPFSFPADFLGSLDRYIERLRGSASGQVALWGGASKGVIFSLFMERAGVTIDSVIDINPAKQGRYLAGTGIRVLSPEEGMRVLRPGADLFVMNPNYCDEVRAQTNGRYNYLTFGADS